MYKVLVDNATSSGTYGEGGINGNYFKWPGFSLNSSAPLTFYVNISGTATVTMKGTYKSNGTLVPISGAEWSSSVIDAVYAPMNYFAFEIDITSGTVTIAVMS